MGRRWLTLAWLVLAAGTGFSLGKILPVDFVRNRPADKPEKSELPVDPATRAPEGVADSVLAEEWKWYVRVEAANPGALAALAVETAAIEDSGMRAEMRRLVMKRWLAIDSEAALQWAAAGGRRDYFDALFGAWAGADHDGAIAAAEALDDPDRRKRAFSEICRVLASGDDPAGFLNWAKGLDRDLVHREFFGIAIANLARNDLEAARRIAGEIQGDPARTKSLRSLAEVWADSDPAAALAWARTLENRDDTDQVIASIIRKVAADDPELAGREFQKLQDPRLSRDSIAREIAEELTRSEPESGIHWLKDYAGELGLSRFRAGIVRTALKSGPAPALRAMEAIGEWPPRDPFGGGESEGPDLYLMDGDPGKFVADLDALPGKPGPKSLFRLSLVTLWGSRDFPKAWEYVSTFANSDERLKLMNAVMRRPDDWTAAWEKSESLPESIRPEIQNHLIYNIKFRDLEQAVSLYQEPPARGQDAHLASELAFRLSKNGMRHAIAFAESLPPGSSRGTAWLRVIDAWSFKDPAGLSRWADRLEPGSVRDKAAEKLAETLRADDPEAAFAWAAAIRNYSTRSRQVDSVVREWKRNDPRAAESFLLNTTLISGEKREILLRIFQQE